MLTLILSLLMMMLSMGLALIFLAYGVYNVVLGARHLVKLTWLQIVYSYFSLEHASNSAARLVIGCICALISVLFAFSCSIIDKHWYQPYEAAYQERVDANILIIKEHCAKIENPVTQDRCYQNTVAAASLYAAKNEIPVEPE